MSDHTPPTLHIIAQPWWHMPAWIIGDRAALESLRTAIDGALASSEWDVANVYARDGEGYGALVVLRNDMADVPFGYTDEMARYDMPHPEWMQTLMRDACAPYEKEILE